MAQRVKRGISESEVRKLLEPFIDREVQLTTAFMRSYEAMKRKGKTLGKEADELYDTLKTKGVAGLEWARTKGAAGMEAVEEAAVKGGKALKRNAPKLYKAVPTRYKVMAVAIATAVTAGYYKYTDMQSDIEAKDEMNVKDARTVAATRKTMEALYKPKIEAAQARAAAKGTTVLAHRDIEGMRQTLPMMKETVRKLNSFYSKIADELKGEVAGLNGRMESLEKMVGNINAAMTPMKLNQVASEWETLVDEMYSKYMVGFDAIRGGFFTPKTGATKSAAAKGAFVLLEQMSQKQPNESDHKLYLRKARVLEALNTAQTGIYKRTDEEIKGISPVLATLVGALKDGQYFRLFLTPENAEKLNAMPEYAAAIKGTTVEYNPQTKAMTVTKGQTQQGGEVKVQLPISEAETKATREALNGLAREWKFKGLELK